VALAGCKYHIKWHSCITERAVLFCVFKRSIINIFFTRTSRISQWRNMRWWTSYVNQSTVTTTWDMDIIHLHRKNTKITNDLRNPWYKTPLNMHHLCVVLGFSWLRSLFSLFHYQQNTGIMYMWTTICYWIRASFGQLKSILSISRVAQSSLQSSLDYFHHLKRNSIPISSHPPFSISCPWQVPVYVIWSL
jgi:hypothetical protein